MANSKSARKNIRKNRSRAQRNRAVKTQLKTLEKKFRANVEAVNIEDATESARAFSSALDKAMKKSLIHRNKVARKKAYCSSAIARLSEGKATKAPEKEASVEEEPAATDSE